MPKKRFTAEQIIPKHREAELEWAKRRYRLHRWSSAVVDCSPGCDGERPAARTLDTDQCGDGVVAIGCSGDS